MPRTVDPWALVPPELEPRVRTYLTLLHRWTRKIDLVAPADLDTLLARHVLDSLAQVPLLPARSSAKVVDVGSGAGLPGIPWAMARPDLPLTLVEPRSRRVAFLSTAVRELGLGNVTIVDTRAEDLADEARTFDLVASRAVLPFPRWLDLAVRLIAPDGAILAMAGAQPPAGWSMPGGGLSMIQEIVYQLPGLGTRRAATYGFTAPRAFLPNPWGVTR